ncbi:MAG: flagellin [Candidatus Cloacimonadota bacterium]|nr:MAG: flagellin [Candidatus Cloacimonadota bacterium]
MSLVINHNLMAQNTARNLSVAYGRLGNSVQRLSTGLRINSAADDAAGLAIREQMRAEIATMNQGVRNAQDAISMIQTAEGALGVIDEKLIRMKELAEQAATGTYTNDQRLIIHSEFSAMAAEIDRIANATDFNGVKMLNGNVSLSGTNGKWSENNTWVADEGLYENSSGWQEINGSDNNGDITGGIKIHFGTGNNRAEDYYFMRIGDMRTSSLFNGTNPNVTDANANAANVIAVSSQAAAQEALEQISTAIARKDNIRASLGAVQNRLENTITNLSIQAENLQAAESRISDIDVASEMTQFTRNQILTQSGVGMLSQANSLPQMALRLIG